MKLSIRALIRPDDVLKLVCLPGYDKVKHFGSISNLWQILLSESPDTVEYRTAHDKLLSVSEPVKATLTRSGINNAAAQAAAYKNQALAKRSKTCGICMNSFRVSKSEQGETRIPSSEYPVILECGDIFCYHCLSMWLRQHAHCPALGCGKDFGNRAEVRSKIESQVQRHDSNLARTLDLME